LRPPWIVRQHLAFFEHQFAELLDAQLFDEELHARATAIALFAEAGEHPARRLRERQYFFFTGGRAEKLVVVRHGSQAARDHYLEAATRDTVLLPGLGDEAQVVNVGQAAAAGLAAGERDLELAAHVLRVRVTEQVVGQRLRVRSGVEGF